MNLLQIQDQLKSLPTGPQTMQALMAYANGANPAVPPYLALGELNRRKQLMEQAQMQQASQPPQGTVKEQVEQQAGIMALQQQQAQQMMPAPQVGGSMTPQMGVGAPVRAAGGGLMALLAEKARERRMNSGGIISFSGGSKGAVGAEEDDDDDEADVTDAEALSPAQALMRMKEASDLVKKFAENTKAPEVNTTEKETARRIKEDPERYGYLKNAPGEGVLERLEALQQARRAELDKQREESAKLKPGILQLLGQAAMNSRGQQGRSALASILGGYADLQSGADAKEIAREQDIRAKDLEMQQVKMEVINKLQEAKRAHDEGDIGRAVKEQMLAAQIAQKHNTTIGNLLGKNTTAAAGYAGRIGSATIAANAKVKAAAAAAARAARDTDQTRGIEILKADIREKNPGLSETQVAAEALRQYRLGTPAGAGVGQRTAADAMKALADFKLMNRRQWKAYVEANGGDETAAAVKYVDDYKANVLPPQLMPRGSEAAGASPAAAPAVATPTNAPPASMLKEGVNTTFENGQTWTLKDGKPVKVK